MKDIVPILPDYDEKVGTMNVTPQMVRDAESAGYAHYMATMLRASDGQREENRKLAEIRKKRHGIDPTAQQPSTLAIMARPKEKDEEHWLRPLPKEVLEQSAKLAAAVAQGDDAAIRALVAERAVTLEEVSHVEAIRRRPKNSQGQSEKSSVGEEKRETAIQAFVYSTPAELTPDEKQRIIQLTPYTQVPVPPEDEPEPPESLGSKFLHWLWKRGVPVDKIARKQLTVEEADKT